MPVKSKDRSDYENAVAALGVMPKEYLNGSVVEMHKHDRGQLIYAISGLMEISTEDGLWLIPPQHALWMPPGKNHRLRAHDLVSMRTLYVRSDAIPCTFPVSPRITIVSTFLRELILRASGIPIDYDEHSHDAQILSLILGEIDWRQNTNSLCLMMPNDKRLLQVCEAIMKNPGDTRSLEEWSEVSGASSRTLARLYKAELGISFTYWRQHIRMMAAMSRLASGDSITNISQEMGYNTVSAFSKVFKGVMGVPPSYYFKN